jgi:hypothetical protein
VAQCTIANPAVAQAFAALDDMLLDAWNPDSMSWTDYPRSLVFDGNLVWMATRFAIAGARHTIGSVNNALVFACVPHSYTYGPMAFDGKYLWFGMADVGGSPLASTYMYHMVRFNPASLEIVAAAHAGVQVAGDLLALIARSDRWLMEAPRDNVAGPLIWSSGGFELFPFGNIMFDGDSLYWSKAYWRTGAAMDARCMTLQRLANVHGV